MAQRLLLHRGLLAGGRLRICYACAPHLRVRTICTAAAPLGSLEFYSQSNRKIARRWFGSTPVLNDEDAPKEEQPTKEAEPTKNDSNTEESSKSATEIEGGGDDECPPWQNPLHVGNPDYQPEKVFEEDFEPGEEIPKVPLPPLDNDGSGKVLAPPHLHELADEIVNLTMLEMNDLTNKIGEHFGLEDDSGVGIAAAAGVGVSEGAAEEEGATAAEEKTAFDLKLTGFDAKAKIKVIKEVRAIGGFGLKEAKELVEGAPKTIKTGIKKEEAEELKAKLEEVGGTIEIV